MSREFPKRKQSQPEIKTSGIKKLLSSFSHDENSKNCSPGQRIGKYVVKRILACKGQATVVLALDPHLRRHVILKLYHSELSDRHKVRLIDEGRALARISDPHVAACYGVEDFDGNPFLTLEIVEGQSLKEYITQSQPVLDEALDILRQISDGLQRVHGAGLFHCDLKPANVMIDAGGHVTLIDFGLVKSLVSPAKGTGSGTPAYMAPERLRSGVQVADERSDIFGAGAIFYELVVGKPPFAADSSDESRELVRAGNVTPIRVLNPSVPANVAALGMKCLEKHPRDRFQSANELLTALKKLMAQRASIVGQLTRWARLR